MRLTLKEYNNMKTNKTIFTDEYILFEGCKYYYINGEHEKKLQEQSMQTFIKTIPLLNEKLREE